MYEISQDESHLFEREEYEERLQRAKDSMNRRGVDVLLVTNPANMCYLTGYDAWSFYVHQLVVVSLEAEEPIWIGRKMDANAARVTTFLSRENILPYTDDYVQAVDKHPFDYVAKVLKDRGWERARIAVEMDTYYFTAACYETLKRDLPDAAFTDSGALVNWVRIIKSPREIAFMQRAARIVENAMHAGISAIEAGARQCDAVAAISHAQISGTGAFGGDYTSIVPMLPTGIGTSTPHITWSDQRFVSGEATILELAGCYRRYHVPMARTVHIGEPPARLSSCAETVIEGLNKALESVKPGVTGEEVEGAWRETIARHGIEKDSRIGYSTGLAYPPDWGEHTLSLRPGDRTVLEPGMTIHMIPGIWMDDWGVEISETFLVTEDGARRFCDFPQDLVIKGG